MSAADLISLHSGTGSKVAEVLELATRLGANSDKGLERGFVQISLRAVETFVLRHVKVRQLVDYWDAQLGNQRGALDKILKEIFDTNVSSDLSDYFYDLIDSNANRLHEAKVTTALKKEVLQELFDSGVHDLKCFSCGYHFTVNDVGKMKDSVLEVGLRLETTAHPRRLSDTLKPVLRPGKDGKDDLSYTVLNFDHIVPRVGYGASRKANLQTMCGLCNWGKGCYRYPFGAISSIIALSLTNADSETNWSVLEDVFASTIRANPRCIETGKDATQTELTIRPKVEMDTTPGWFVPWNFETVSYEVFDPQGE